MLDPLHELLRCSQVIWWSAKLNGSCPEVQWNGRSGRVRIGWPRERFGSLNLNFTFCRLTPSYGLPCFEPIQSHFLFHDDMGEHPAHVGEEYQRNTGNAERKRMGSVSVKKP